VASSHRQISEDSNAGYTEAGCGDDGKLMGASAGQQVARPWQQSPPVPATRLEAGPAYHLAALSELMILHRIGCHVMPFPPRRCMNRYQSGNSGPAPAPHDLYGRCTHD
jgi:hypothetical protein